MLPIVLDLAMVPVLLIGDGMPAETRLTRLRDSGALRVRQFVPPALPSERELAPARLVFITDRTAPYIADILFRAHAFGALVHVEDDPARTDFHLPAVLRRGDLTIAISTGGASPGLAVWLKGALGALFGPEWRDRTAEAARLRRQWREEGADAAALKRRTECWIEGQDWLSDSVPRFRK